jgi:hypothetical protein
MKVPRGFESHPFSRPKFSPSLETTLSFIVEFRALRTVDPLRWEVRHALTARVGMSEDERALAPKPGQIASKPISVAPDYAYCRMTQYT